MKRWNRARRAALAVATLGAASTALAEVARDGLPTVVMEERAGRTERPERPRFTARTAVPSREVRLGARSAAETRQIEAERRAAAPGRPFILGATRELASADRVVEGARLQWQAVPGGHVAEIAYAADGAHALRLRFRLAGPAHGVTLRFAGSDKPDEVVEVAGADTLRAPRFWGPVTQGARMRVEIFVADGVQRDRVRLADVALMHLDAVTPATLAQGQGPLGQASLACHQDVNCSADGSEPWRQLVRSVVGIGFTRADGRTGWCSGTLVNSNTVPRLPYVVTAAHCINTPEAAASAFMVFFLESAACGTREPRAESVAVAGGATLLTTNRNADHALLQWNGRVPAGVAYAGWTASAVSNGTQIVGVHHPAGDLKKYSLGSKTSEQRNVNVTGLGVLAGPFHQVSWRSGAIEPGSSGSGLFAFDGSGYRLVGQLMGYVGSGAPTCASQAQYGRFQDVVAAARPWLDQPNPLAVVNSASYQQQDLAADQIVAGFSPLLPQAAVTRIGTDRVSGDGRCQFTLGGRYSLRVRSLASGRVDEACIAFIGGGQINAILPATLTPGDRADLEVLDGESVLARAPAAPIAAFAPGIYTATQDGKGVPAGNLVRVRNGEQRWETLSTTPIDLGIAAEELYLVLYGTGLRGKAASTAVTATIAGIPAAVEYFGAQPSYLGLDQINLRIPKSALREARVSGQALLELRFRDARGVDTLANPLDLYFR